MESAATETLSWANMGQDDTVHHWEAVHRPPHEGAWEPDGPYEVPPGYGVDRLVLLIRDPRCVFAFWEVTEQGWTQAAGRLPAFGEPPRLTLRVHDLTGQEAHWDVSPGRAPFVDLVVEGADRWYIHLPQPGRTVVAEIGAGTAGAFVPIARSQPVQTPPGTVSDWVDGDWMTVDAAYRLLPVGMVSATSPGLFGPLVRQREERDRQQAVTPLIPRETC